ncbi:branched-chain amino acid aminotransferase [Pelagibacteraceae bacterium]|jgi:branched-chain amino acid aminotransferase|nr:branched-chain amino acid aminotransferase [Pelagibacteraceae bacterium]|tara:strand:- start:902 stop:1792 length:891 start_codon:yes stop_codon:yes gene_type:complete
MEPIPYDKREGKIWFNGDIIDWKDAKLHVLTHGLHYGSCVFEGERVYNGEIFKLREHTNRLVYSANRMGFDIPYSVDEIDDACNQIIKIQNVKNGYVRPVAWRGSEMMAISAQKNKIHFAIATWEWGSYFDPKIKENGIKLNISKWRRPAPNTIPWDTKAAGLYMICTLSKHEAEKEGYNDSLMLDHQDFVAEATGANIFFIKENSKEIHTPVPDCFLDGITRRTIIDIAKENNFKINERKIKLEELKDFDACFLTGTAAEVTPVSEIGNYKFKVTPSIGKFFDRYLDIVNRKVTV